MKNSRRCLISIIIVMSFFMCGAIIKKSEPLLDISTYPAYQNVDFDDLSVMLYSNSDQAKKKYDNQFFMVLGKVKYRDNNHKGIQIGSIKNSATTQLICKLSDSASDKKSVIDKLLIGDKVKVYGKLTYDPVIGEWKLVMDQIEPTDQTKAVTTAFSVKSGTTIDANDMMSRSLVGGRISFRIPEKWTTVEHSLIDEGLGRLEGYQYCLNEIDQQSVTPESLFVCYFENAKHIQKSGDKTNTEGIERAVVKNLLGSDPGKPAKRRNYFGSEYHYYEARYAPVGIGYHADFIFEPLGTEGLVMYLYIYKEPMHRDEVALVMRQLRHSSH